MMVLVATALAVELPASVDLDRPPPSSPAGARSASGTDPWVADYNSAVEKLNAGDHEGCVTSLTGLVPPSATGEGARLGRSLAWECASRRGWYARAGRFVAQGIEAGTHDARAVIPHANTLVQADRAAEAVQWLDLFPLPEVSAWHSALARAAAAAQDWGRLATLGAESAVPVRLRAQVGITLVQAKRRTEGRAVLTQACPGLEPEERAQCEVWLTR